MSTVVKNPFPAVADVGSTEDWQESESTASTSMSKLLMIEGIA
jgi:hypothetical protein